MNINEVSQAKLFKASGAISLVLLMLVNIAGASTIANNNSKWVSGAYTGYHASLLPPEDIYWDGLTQIEMGAVLVNSDGSLDTSFYDPTNGPILAKKISNLAHQNNKKAILVVGGEGNGANIASAVKNHKSLLVSNLVTVMNTYGYDGFDLDWEENVDYTDFVSFAQALKEAAPNAILMLPVGMINGNYQTVDPGVVELSQYMDQVNMMSYYPTTTMTGSGWYSWFNSPLKGEKYTTPISIEDSLRRYNAAGIPKNKLGMGISFYAIGYAGNPTITGPNQPTETTNYIVGGDNKYPLSKLYGEDWENYKKYLHWSDEALVPYLSLPYPDWSGARYISFENPQSIIEKGKFTYDNGYGGILIWNLNQGYVKTSSDPNFLMKALQKGFLEPATSSDKI
jgi:chitinase